MLTEREQNIGGNIERSRTSEVAEKEIALKIIPYNIRRAIVLNNSIFISLFLGFLQSPG